MFIQLKIYYTKVVNRIGKIIILRGGIHMNIKIFEQFKPLKDEELLSIEGGKTIYYGNGLYCNTNRFWGNWSQTATIIANNSVMNGLTGGNAGWHSGGRA